MKNMKTIRIFALTMFSLVACTKINDSNNVPASKIDSFTISMANLSDGKESKTTFIEYSGKYNKLVWQANDQLYVTRTAAIPHHGNSFSYATFKTTTGGGTTALFDYVEGDIPAGEGNYAVAYTGTVDFGACNGFKFNSNHVDYAQVFIPKDQEYVENGIKANTMPMYGFGPSLNNLTLKCAGNVVRLNLYSTAANTRINKIKLETVDADNRSLIAGPFAIDSPESDLIETNVNWGMWSVASYSSNIIEYDCTDSGYLSSSSETPTAFNIVISRYKSGGEKNITATIYYSIDGGEEKTRVKVLSNLDQTQRQKLGYIFNFSAKNIADDSAW